jgi:AIPR protein
MISDRQIDQAFSDLRTLHGGVREDYYGLLYLEKEYNVPRDKALNQIAFGGNDYGIDGFHFDPERRNLYLFQFKRSDSHALFKGSYKRLIEDGLARVFTEPTKDPHKNQVLLQLRSCLHENRSIIDQVCFRFVFTGDPQEAERSTVLEMLREQLENKKYLADRFFIPRDVGFLIEYRSTQGRVGAVRTARGATSFAVAMDDLVILDGPGGEKMHVGFVRLHDLDTMYSAIGRRFFDSNIRYGLGESKAVNRAIGRSLKAIVIDRAEQPSVFAFNHNGITLFAEDVQQEDSAWRLTAPRLLNGAQTVTTVKEFFEANKGNPKLDQGRPTFEQIRVLCKVITNADPKFVTHVTINNNRQNPVEPWNLHANDEIQLELQDKFRSDIGIYYERQENAFDQLSAEDLEEYGITEDAKAIQMLKLTQTFVLTDGHISRISDMRRLFEEDKLYSNVFRSARLKADSRHILLCYKVQFRLRKIINEIEQKGQNKYAFVHRGRYLLWALICQGLLNSHDLEGHADSFGTAMTLPVDYTTLLSQIATTRVRHLLSNLMALPAYKAKAADGNYSFLRTDSAFEKCLEVAYEKWGWVHKKLQ